MHTTHRHAHMRPHARTYTHTRRHNGNCHHRTAAEHMSRPEPAGAICITSPPAPPAKPLSLLPRSAPGKHEGRGGSGGRSAQQPACKGAWQRCSLSPSSLFLGGGTSPPPRPNPAGTTNRQIWQRAGRRQSCCPGMATCSPPRLIPPTRCCSRCGGWGCSCSGRCRSAAAEWGRPPRPSAWRSPPARQQASSPGP